MVFNDLQGFCSNSVFCITQSQGMRGVLPFDPFPHKHIFLCIITDANLDLMAVLERVLLKQTSKQTKT